MFCYVICQSKGPSYLIIGYERFRKLTRISKKLLMLITVILPQICDTLQSFLTKTNHNFYSRTLHFTSIVYISKSFTVTSTEFCSCSLSALQCLKINWFLLSRNCFFRSRCVYFRHFEIFLHLSLIHGSPLWTRSMD